LSIGSLFSGIGGLELALEHCGLGPVIWQAERDPYASAVLAKHWPTVKRYDDVRKIDGNSERPDVICGGFPCQDISYAGLGAGIEGERSGLWSEYARIVRQLRPRYVFIENVAALLTRGLDRVLGDLAACGYDAEWEVLGACCAGAPHQRERIFVLAFNADSMRHGLEGNDTDDGIRHAPDKSESSGLSASVDYSGHWLGARPNGARPVGVGDGPTDEVDRLRCLGNAVVPQQAALAWKILIKRSVT
jgi:DNA (cytosine-5)-methyltransferase 1